MPGLLPLAMLSIRCDHASRFCRSTLAASVTNQTPRGDVVHADIRRRIGGGVAGRRDQGTTHMRNKMILAASMTLALASTSAAFAQTDNTTLPAAITCTRTAPRSRPPLRRAPAPFGTTARTTVRCRRRRRPSGNRTCSTTARAITCIRSVRLPNSGGRSAAARPRLRRLFLFLM